MQVESVTFDDIPSTISHTLTITPSLGRITDATVTAYDAAGPNGGTVLGTGQVDESGQASFQITYSTYGPIVIRLEAGENSLYFDEQAGEVSLPPGTQLHALVATPTHTAVTPLTELAYQLAVSADAFPITSDDVNYLNSTISDVFSGGLLNINSAPELLSQYPAPLSQASGLDSYYAMVLASLAKIGETASHPALATLDALKHDMRDGRFNSRDNGAALTGFPSYPDRPLRDARIALHDWLTTYGTQNAQATLAAMPLPVHVIDPHAGHPRDRLISMKHGEYDLEVAYATEGWAAFPTGKAMTLAIAESGEVTLFDDGEPLSEWSFNTATTPFSDLVHDPDVHSLMFDLPVVEGEPLRSVYFVFRGDGTIGPVILAEDDSHTGLGADRIAHVLNYADNDFMTRASSRYFEELNTQAQAGRSLTVVKDETGETVNETLCQQVQLGVVDGSYPKAAGIIFEDGQEWAYSLQPQRMRFRRAGKVKEFRFSGEASIRLDTVSGRMDVYRHQGSELVFWATTAPAEQMRACGSRD